jgi:hypothetical protein
LSTGKIKQREPLLTSFQVCGVLGEAWAKNDLLVAVGDMTAEGCTFRFFSYK